MQVIYADVLIATNILVDYLLLRASAAIMSVRAKPIRLLAAAAIGGVYSLIVFVQLPDIAAFLLKLATLTLMVAAAFGFGTPKGFLRCSAVFFLANLVFAGVMLAVWYNFLPNSILYKNGAIYFDVDVLTLVISAVVCYAVLTLLSFFARKRTQRGNVFEVRIICGDKSAEGRALFDTGNSLRESFSGRPTVIAESKFIRPVLPPNFNDFVNGNSGRHTDFKGFRMIPFSTVNQPGVIPAFKADILKIFVGDEWHELRDIYVAVSEKRFAAAEFDLLLGTPVFDMINNEVKDCDMAKK